MSVVLPDFAVPAGEIDFGNFETWPDSELGREAMFAKLRRERRISFHSEPEFEMQAEVEGERLTAAEFGSFFVLLVAAGNETTRNAISHGLLELTRHPDQREILVGDFERLPDIEATGEPQMLQSPFIHGIKHLHASFTPR